MGQVMTEKLEAHEYGGPKFNTPYLMFPQALMDVTLINNTQYAENKKKNKQDSRKKIIKALSLALIDFLE